jgi:Kef-type K+ transport system membrane component KefB
VARALANLNKIACVPDGSPEPHRTAGNGRPRLPAFYAILTLLVGAAAVLALVVAGDREAEQDAAGTYRVTAGQPCLGDDILLRHSGQFATVAVEGDVIGRIRIREGHLDGTVGCLTGPPAEIDATLRNGAITGTLDGERLEARLVEPQRDEFAPEAVADGRAFGDLLATFFLALVVVMAAARLCGAAAVAIRQPRVMGEVVAGILLGPSLFGAVLPGVQAEVFPEEILPILGVVATFGLIFYMFLIGVEIDLSQLRVRASQIGAVSVAGIAVPMAVGLSIAGPVYEVLAPETGFVEFALFLATALSITAFPVLARILDERGMLSRPIGTTTMAAAAIDDVLAWLLVALATTVALAGSGRDVAFTILAALAFGVVMFKLVRPAVRRLSAVFEAAGTAPSAGWLTVIFGGVLLSAWATERIGLALIFGAFVMGLVMPRGRALTAAVTGRIEDFVVIILLPLFFVYTGLRTDVGLLDRPELWLLTLGLIVAAILAKLVGTMVAARLTGFSWRGSAVIGTLMNTRGLTELILLNLALEIGVISEALFTALVLMALVTTFMAGPLLRLLDPWNRFGGGGGGRAASAPAPSGP